MRRGSAVGSVRESFRLVEDAVLVEEVAEEDDDVEEVIGGAEGIKEINEEEVSME
jgi:hypothetical protein